MNRLHRRLVTLASQGLLVLLAACSGGPRPATPRAPAAPVATAATDADAILVQLLAGDGEGARTRLAAALKRDPMNPSLLVLRDSVDQDPKLLLGPQSAPYVVQAGDTVTSLAERHLGNRLKAYQLLRYNGLAAPAVLTPGQVIRIPGEQARPVEPPAPRAVPGRPRPGTPPAAKPVAVRPSAAAAAPVANPAAARQARAAGLAALNQGKIGQAVALLRRAAALDPGNPLAARDLARAERIAATVKTHR